MTPLCKRITILLLCVAAALAIAAPDANAQLGRLKFGEHKINRIQLLSLRSVAGEAQVVCTNDSLAFTMSNIAGTVYKNGRAFVHGTANPVTVPVGKSTVVVKGTASLCEGIGFWDVLSCIAFKAEDYTIDVAMTIANTAGDTRVYSKKGLSVAALLGNRHPGKDDSKAPAPASTAQPAKQIKT